MNRTTHYELQLEQALQLIEENDFTNAIQHLEDTIQKFPQLAAEPHLYLGYLYEEQQQWHTALEHYQKALQNSRNQLKLQQLQKKSNQTQPPHHHNHNPLHWWLNTQTRPYLKALKAIANLHHYHLHNLEEAIAHYCQLLNLLPQDPQAVLEPLAEAYLANQQSNATIDLLSRVRKKTSVCHYTLGLAYHLENQTKKRYYSLQQGIKKNPFVAYLLKNQSIPTPLKKRNFPHPDQELWYAQKYVNRFAHHWRNHLQILPPLP